MKRHAPPGLPAGCPYPAVGIHRASESAIGLPTRSTSASWMLGFLMPADVRRNLMLPPESLLQASFWALTDPYAVETGRPPKTHRLWPEPASRPQRTAPNLARSETRPEVR